MLRILITVIAWIQLNRPTLSVIVSINILLIAVCRILRSIDLLLNLKDFLYYRLSFKSPRIVFRIIKTCSIVNRRCTVTIWIASFKYFFSSTNTSNDQCFPIDNLPTSDEKSFAHACLFQDCIIEWCIIFATIAKLPTDETTDF